MIRRILLLVLGIIFLSFPQLYAAHLHPERVYQDQWCAKAGGVTEYVLDDGSRVDCLTDDYAIEFDFGPKWAEAIGQALYYGIRTARKPGVVLILEREHPAFQRRLFSVAAKYGIRVWFIRPEDLTADH